MLCLELRKVENIYRKLSTEVAPFMRSVAVEVEKRNISKVREERKGTEYSQDSGC